MSERGKEQGQRGTDDALRALGVDPAKAREAPANAEEIIAAQQRGMALIDEVAEKAVRGLDHLKPCRLQAWFWHTGQDPNAPLVWRALRQQAESEGPRAQEVGDE